MPHIDIIAEIGSNHGGDLDTAKRYIEAAARAGADVAKFQTLTRDGLIVAAIASPFALAMTFLGARLVRRIDPERFYVIIYWLLAAVSVKLIVDAVLWFLGDEAEAIAALMPLPVG